MEERPRAGKPSAKKRCCRSSHRKRLAPKNHPIRHIEPIVDRVLEALSPTFAGWTPRSAGLPSRRCISSRAVCSSPLRRPLGARRRWVQLCERLQYDPSASLRAGAPVQMVPGPQRHRPSLRCQAFSHNKERLHRHEAARQFFDRVIEEARRRKLLPPDHFTVDGTLLEAWASIKSFRPKDAAGPGAVGKNPEVDFRGKPRRNDSHASTTDPEARLAR